MHTKGIYGQLVSEHLFYAFPKHSVVRSGTIKSCRLSSPSIFLRSRFPVFRRFVVLYCSFPLLYRRASFIGVSRSFKRGEGFYARLQFLAVAVILGVISRLLVFNVDFANPVYLFIFGAVFE